MGVSWLGLGLFLCIDSVLLGVNVMVWTSVLLPFMEMPDL